ncbi:unnamed protein product [Rotaria sp. Silwood2]|nr:unnamed protein product [Rotaria sp. Silwood2]CAF3314086.1 unnamed protein product [Rotaria sp. Silwood2]CAF3408043.1 unnamed protein product [Rotaria sp. Silwood2]CAF4386758.1 unnamed protein product [Rotaria sp. Silwood2]CAF4407997.1 unnamed protein product [Rotaria sp. Silwood2]
MDSMTDYLLDKSNNILDRSKFVSSTSILQSNVTLSAADLTKTLIPEQYQIILLSFAYGIITFLALIGNSSIIYIVICNRRMHSVTNYFICNLALADCLVACFAVPFQFQAAALQKWVLPHFLCKLAPFVQILSVDVSIYTLVAVSLDRYYVMLHPLKPKLSTKTAFIIFTIIWLIALGSSIPSLFFYNVYFIDDFGYQCLPYIYEKQEHYNSTKSTINRSYYIHKIYIVYNIYSQYIIPFIIISCAYFRIGSHLYFSKPVGQTKYQEVIARNKRKVLKMLFVVVILFLICWFPLQLYNFLNVYKPEINDFKHIVVLWLCANWLAMSNSCHNPFIYGFCSARFNREFRKLYRCFPCIDENKIDGELTDNRTNIPLLNKVQKKRQTFKQCSPNSSSHQHSRQNTTTSINNIPLNSQLSSISMKNNLNDKRHQFFFSNRHQNQFLTNNYINYYSSTNNRAINNCEKFLLDQDLTKTSKENDLLFYHNNQSTRFT